MFFKMLSLFLVTFFAASVPALAEEKKPEVLFGLEVDEAPSLCRDFKKILTAPENKNYVLPYSAFPPDKKALRRERIDNWYPLVIPENSKNFVAPVWVDVSVEEARGKIGHAIQDSFLNAKFGVDYWFKKASIDLDADGKPDTIYHRQPITWGYSMELGEAPLNKYFATASRQYEQIILYRERPYFINTGMSRVGNVAVLRPRTLGDVAGLNKKTVNGFYLQTVCRFKTFYAGDK